MRTGTAAIALALLVVAAAVAGSLPYGVPVIDVHGDYCFRLPSGWTAEPYDEDTRSITTRHGATVLRTRAEEGCWLVEERSTAEARRIQRERHGFGPLAGLHEIDGRHGPGRLAVYRGDGAALEAYGCVFLGSPRSWMVLEGTIEPGDEDAVVGLLGRTRADCERLEPDLPPPSATRE